MPTEDDDLAVLAEAFIENLTYDPSCEYGSIGTDPKRPFGNSDVEGDILELIGADPEDGESYSDEQREYAASLYKEKLVPYLQKRWAEMNS